MLSGDEPGKLEIYPSRVLLSRNPPPAAQRPPQTPSVTEVVYLQALINPGSRFDSFKTRLPVNGEHCGAVVRRASSQLPRATSERRSEVRVGCRPRPAGAAARSVWVCVPGVATRGERQRRPPSTAHCQRGAGPWSLERPLTGSPGRGTAGSGTDGAVAGAPH
jgi:hypothetical protein